MLIDALPTSVLVVIVLATVLIMATYTALCLAESRKASDTDNAGHPQQEDGSPH